MDFHIILNVNYTTLFTLNHVSTKCAIMEIKGMRRTNIIIKYKNGEHSHTITGIIFKSTVRYLDFAITRGSDCKHAFASITYIPIDIQIH